jgi:hypothetical protein
MALSLVDLISIGAVWGQCGGRVDTCPTGTPSEVYSPVGVIVDANPEEVATIARTKEHTVVVDLFNNTLGVVVHQVSEPVLGFLTLGSDKCEVKHDRIVLTCSV